jgi:hypothetical protein
LDDPAGYWCDPAADRNEGMAATRSPWVVFWDTDNVMPAGFLAAVREAIRHATPDVGILYSDIEYVDENLNYGKRWRVPDWNYWTLRKGNHIDTASAWRREAVELAGGWPRGFRSSEDYALPRHTALYVVDNSGDAEFTSRVHQTSQELAADRHLDHVSLSVRPDRYLGQVDEPYFVRERHPHIRPALRGPAAQGRRGCRADPGGRYRAAAGRDPAVG